MIAIFETKFFLQPSQSADYNLSDDSFDPDASQKQTVDYEQYSLSGQTNSKQLLTHHRLSPFRF